MISLRKSEACGCILTTVRWRKSASRYKISWSGTYSSAAPTPNKIAKAAPVDAPELMPNVNGSASILRTTACKTAPATDHERAVTKHRIEGERNEEECPGPVNSGMFAA